MKYVDSEKITAEIDKIIDGIKKNCNPNPLGTMEECMASAEIEALELVKTIIDQMKQEEPTPPGIEEESKKKGYPMFRQYTTDGRNEMVQKFLAANRCPKCGGEFKQTRSGSFRIVCQQCGQKAQLKRKNK